MSLESYAKKRNFQKTPEPEPKEHTETKGKELIFVVHEHHASHLHWDLRLEHEGVLKSWAVPKEPPTEAGVKRLAVEVEDHPIEYADFHGIIPGGHYGAGEVSIWDSGTYTPEKFSDKEILVDFHGKKLFGKYLLIKTAFKGAKNSWLFFKKK